MKRIFIVGTARSGTTLLQSILNTHEEIFSLPETHFFDKTIPSRKILRLFSKITDSKQEWIRSFIAKYGEESLYSPYTGDRRDFNAWTNYIIALLDNLAKNKNKKIWIEKTPLTLRYIDLIQKNQPNTLFLHLIREPLSNIAALYDISNRHPNYFRQATLKGAIKRYKKDFNISKQYINLYNHCFVFYEDLVKNPEQTIQNVCRFIGVNYTENMLQDFKNTETIISHYESWKENNKKDIEFSDKIHSRLSPQQINFVKQKTRNLNLKPFQQ